VAENCIFCKIARKEIPAKVVSESEKWITFRDVNPQAPVHILIIPKQHVSRLSDVPVSDAGLMAEMVLELKRLAAEEGISDSGYRVVANCNAQGGQTVWHLHFHLLGGRSMGWPPG